MDFILPFIIALAVVIIIRLLAGTDNIIGHICRAFWNISFKIVAFIPFMGWMSHFIIADTDAEIRAKKVMLKRAEQLIQWLTMPSMPPQKDKLSKKKNAKGCVSRSNHVLTAQMTLS